MHGRVGYDPVSFLSDAEAGNTGGHGMSALPKGFYDFDVLIEAERSAGVYPIKVIESLYTKNYVEVCSI